MIESTDPREETAEPTPDGLDAPAQAAAEPDEHPAEPDQAAEADQTAEPAEPEIETPQQAPADEQAAAQPAKKVKRLAAGGAAARSGAGLKSAGVATFRALAVPERKTRKSKKAAEGEEVQEFDPAADLPMYREGMDWFVLRVASNKENYVRETLLKKVQIEGMTHLVGRIMVPTEKTKTLKSGKARITETKLYPGYVFVEMKLEPDGRIPQDVFFLIKETTGVGDFVGTAGRPTPMATPEVEKMLFDSRKPEELPTVKMEFVQGDHVTIKEGPFQNYDGTVDEVLPDKGLVRVLVTIFGRQAPIELEYWQISRVAE